MERKMTMSKKNETPKTEVIAPTLADVVATPETISHATKEVIRAGNVLNTKTFALLHITTEIPLSADDEDAEVDADGNEIPRPWALEMSVINGKTKKAIDLDELTRADIRTHHLQRFIRYTFGFDSKSNTKSKMAEFCDDQGIAQRHFENTLMDVLMVYYWHHALVEKHGMGLFCDKLGTATDCIHTNRELDKDYSIIQREGEKLEKMPKTFKIYVRTAALDGDYDLPVETLATGNLIKLAKEHYNPTTSGANTSPMQSAYKKLADRLEDTDNKGNQIPISPDDQPSARKLVDLVVNDNRFTKLLADALKARWANNPESFLSDFSCKTYSIDFKVSKEQMQILQEKAQAENVPAVAK